MTKKTICNLILFLTVLWIVWLGSGIFFLTTKYEVLANLSEIFGYIFISFSVAFIFSIYIISNLFFSKNEFEDCGILYKIIAILFSPFFIGVFLIKKTKLEEKDKAVLDLTDSFVDELGFRWKIIDGSYHYLEDDNWKKFESN